MCISAQEIFDTEEEIIVNLKEGVESDSLGLKVCAAYYLVERKLKNSVILLMKFLKSDKIPKARIVAFSLLKIGDEKGLLAVKRVKI